MLCATWNLLTWSATEATFGPLGPDGVHQRHLRVVEVIRTLADTARAAGEGLVVAVQELVADDTDEAGAALAALADATGLACTDTADRPVVGDGATGLKTGLMWTPGPVNPAGEQLRPWPGAWWHGCAIIDLNVAAAPCPIRHASYHAPPFPRRRRIDEAELLLAAVRRPRPDGRRPPVLLGSDANSVSADRVFVPGEQIDPDDATRDRWPYLDPEPRRWHPELAHQCHVQVDDTGKRRWWADRRPAQVLLDGGLRDAAAVVSAPWEPTSGHWTSETIAAAGLRGAPGIEPDPFGPRRIDVVRAGPEITEHALDALTVLARPGLPELAALLATPRHRAAPDPLQTDPARCAPDLASDHRPAVARYRADAIRP